MDTTQEITTGVVDVGDARLRYRERGDGPPVLLLHAGVFGDWFAPVFAEPALDGVRLVEVHRAGYGDSSTPEGHLTFADHARQGVALLRALGIDRATWVGHSSSASMALQAAIDAPDAVSRLVLLEPAPSPAGPSSEELGRTAVGPAVGAAQAGDVRGATDAFMTGVCGPDWADVTRRRLGDAALDRVVRDARFFFADEIVAAMEWPIDETIAARVTAPTTLVYGAAPATHAHEETTRQLAAWVPGAELVALPGVGHAMPLEDPAAVAQLIAVRCAARTYSKLCSGPGNVPSRTSRA
jgi:pimeloyl-ACP methyl ester carboxylesterase